MNEELIASIRGTIVEEAQSDVVGLWAVLWEVKNQCPLLSVEGAEAATLDVVREALSRGELLVGGFDDKNADTISFVPWWLSLSDALQRIEREWTALGREPTLGEIAWLAAPGLLPISMRTAPSG